MSSFNKQDSGGSVSTLVTVFTLLVLAMQGGFIALKLDGKLDWDWVVAFIPAYTLSASYLIGVITMATRWWESNPIRQMQLSQILTKHNKNKQQLEDRIKQLEKQVKEKDDITSAELAALKTSLDLVTDCVNSVALDVVDLQDIQSTQVYEGETELVDDDDVEVDDVPVQPTVVQPELKEEKTEKVMESPFVQTPTTPKSKTSFARILGLLGLATVIGGSITVAWNEPSVPAAIQQVVNAISNWFETFAQSVSNLFA